MQRILAYLVVLIISTSVESQDLYYVTLVRGIVKRENGSVLKTGDQLVPNAKLYFSDKTCRLLLLHPKKGRFLLEAKQTNTTNRGEIILFLQNQLQFQNQTFQLSSRGVQESFEQFFSIRTSDNARLLFIGDMRFDLHNSGYTTSDSLNKFFFLQYVSENGQAVNHKLSTFRDTLMIPAQSFQINGVLPATHPVWKLGYVKNYALRDIQQIASFEPVLLREEACKKLIEIIMHTIGNNREKIMEEAYLQLSMMYGKPSIENLYFLIDHL